MIKAFSYSRGLFYFMMGISIRLSETGQTMHLLDCALCLNDNVDRNILRGFERKSTPHTTKDRAKYSFGRAGLTTAAQVGAAGTTPRWASECVGPPTGIKHHTVAVVMCFVLLCCNGVLVWVLVLLSVISTRPRHVLVDIMDMILRYNCVKCSGAAFCLNTRERSANEPPSTTQN